MTNTDVDDSALAAVVGETPARLREFLAMTEVWR